MKTINEVREQFSKDRYAQISGAEVNEIGENFAVCSLTLSDIHYNAVGGIMGGVYFTLADFTFAVASNWQTPGVVSQSANITYLAPAKGKRLIATANCIKDGRSTCYYRIDITDENQVLLTVVTISGFKVH